MKECNFDCDNCTKSLCTQGNPTLEPTPEEIAETLEDLEKNLPRRESETK